MGQHPNGFLGCPGGHGVHAPRPRGSALASLASRCCSWCSPSLPPCQNRSTVMLVRASLVAVARVPPAVLAHAPSESP
jgi:hypothetical protein